MQPLLTLRFYPNHVSFSVKLEAELRQTHHAD